MILAVFFIATILFIVDALSDLIVSDGEEMRLNHRQQAANEVVVRLYQAEVTGQALSAGKSEYLQDYATAMMNTASAVDSLRVLTSDKVQIARIDSVKILLQKKVDNMEALLVAVESDNSEALYQEYIDELLREQAEAINVPQVANSEVVRTDEYTVAKERKNFFGRLRDAFSRRKNDTVRVSSTTREVHSDTLMQSVNPTDSVVRLLSDVRDRVGNTRLRQIEELNRQIQVLRENGMELSREINRLLAAIVDDSARSAGACEVTDGTTSGTFDAGTGGRLLRKVVPERISSVGEAERWARGLLRAENREATTMVIRTDSMLRQYAAGSVLDLSASAAASWDGTAVVSRIRHDYYDTKAKVWLTRPLGY